MIVPVVMPESLASIVNRRAPTPGSPRGSGSASLLLGLALVAIPSIVNAAPLFALQLSSSAAGRNFLIGLPSTCIDIDTANPAQSTPVSLTVLSQIICTGSPGTSVSAVGNAAGFAAGTTLHASAAASAAGTTPFVNQGLSTASGESKVSVVDEFTITGSGLFELFYSVSGTLSVQDCQVGQASITASTHFGSIALPFYSAVACGSSTGPAQPAVPLVSSQTISLVQSSVLVFGSTLGAAALTGATTDFPTTTASADASHTLSFFLTPLSAGASYSTASGLDYSAISSPALVPESSSVSLLGAGLAGLV
jgi:hypothetical protein